MLALGTAHRVLMKPDWLWHHYPENVASVCLSQKRPILSLEFPFPINRTKLQTSVMSLKSDLRQERSSWEIVDCAEQEVKAALGNNNKKRDSSHGKNSAWAVTSQSLLDKAKLHRNKNANPNSQCYAGWTSHSVPGRGVTLDGEEKGTGSPEKGTIPNLGTWAHAPWHTQLWGLTDSCCNHWAHPSGYSWLLELLEPRRWPPALKDLTLKDLNFMMVQKCTHSIFPFQNTFRYSTLYKFGFVLAVCSVTS